MGKKVVVVPPPPVNVTVNVTVGGTADASAPVVTAAPAPAWQRPALATSPVTARPYVPPFSMPASDVLRRKVPMLARRDDLGLGDHVHTAACVDNDCALLTAQLPPRVTAKPWVAIAWLLLAACVWVVQYSLVVPLAWLGAVARSGGARAVGWFAILLCGLGPFYSLFYVWSPHVPRHALRPWGLDARP